MKEKLRSLVLGILIGALLVPTVYATIGTVTKELSYNDIKITLDGKEITPTDASGNYVEPFIMDGTTYLPVRGIANALELGVEWDSSTKTVKLSKDKPAGDVSADGKTQVGDVIYDKEGVRVTLTEIKTNSSGNFQTYELLIENTSDHITEFYATDIYVNDFMSYNMISTGYIQPGKKTTSSLSFMIGESSSHKKDRIEKIEMNTECRFCKANYDIIKLNRSSIKMNF